MSKIPFVLRPQLTLTHLMILAVLCDGRGSSLPTLRDKLGLSKTLDARLRELEEIGAVEWPKELRVHRTELGKQYLQTYHKLGYRSKHIRSEYAKYMMRQK